MVASLSRFFLAMNWGESIVEFISRVLQYETSCVLTARYLVSIF